MLIAQLSGFGKLQAGNWRIYSERSFSKVAPLSHAVPPPETTHTEGQL